MSPTATAIHAGDGRAADRYVAFCGTRKAGCGPGHVQAKRLIERLLRFVQTQLQPIAFWESMR